MWLKYDQGRELINMNHCSRISMQRCDEVEGVNYYIIYVKMIDRDDLIPITLSGVKKFTEEALSIIESASKSKKVLDVEHVMQDNLAEDLKKGDYSRLNPI